MKSKKNLRFQNSTNMKPKKLIIVIGDAHIYQDHENKLIEQIKRQPYSFPQLIINSNKEYTDINDFKIDDFEIENYQYYDIIKMEMIA